MTTKQAGSGQTIFDIALISYGNLDGGLAQLFADNPGAIDANGAIPFGQSYKITPSKTQDTRIAAAMSAANPTTDNRAIPADWVTASGDTWATSSGGIWTTIQ
jgi:hypothetical protein